MMNLNTPVYLPDANVLMTARHHYYAPDLCPGFWDCLEHHFAAGRLLLVDRVYDEILSPVDLLEWSERAVNDSPVDTANQLVVDAYRRLIDWVEENPQFLTSARVAFAGNADGWLAAYAMASGAVVVTNEVSAPNAQRKVPLPDLCAQFSIRCITPFQMLRELDARFDWRRF